MSWTGEWIREFAAAVREGREPAVGSREGWENLAFILSAYRSMEIGTPVEVPKYSEALAPVPELVS